MKNRFVKIMLILSMLLVTAIPAQAFAADQNCSLNSSNLSNILISNINGQLSQETINKVKAAVVQCSSGKIDSTQLQAILKQLGCEAVAATPAKSAPATPAKSAPATPAKTTPAAQPATPAKATPAAQPATPAKATPAKTTPATPPAAAPVKNTTPVATTPAKPATTTPAAPSAATTTTSNASLGSYEQQVVELVNKERAAAGLPALKINTKLAGVAEKKAEDLRDKGYFSHTSPTYGSPFDMMKQFGVTYSSAGENIAKGQKTPAAVMNGWMNSSGHRANILNSSFTEIGVGYVTDSNGNTYWVQMFIRP